MKNIKNDIIHNLCVVKQFKSKLDIKREIKKRVHFIKKCLIKYKRNTLVLGISGGIDSLTAGLMATLAVKELLSVTTIQYKLIAVRLPYKIQYDEVDANYALELINADYVKIINIAESVTALSKQIHCLEELNINKSDFFIGNIKARIRMIIQYSLAEVYNGLVIGTYNASEAVMGFCTKFGDSACDLAPLSGLTKSQVKMIAKQLNVPTFLVEKIPTADLEDLRPGYPDESCNGIAYTEIDKFLHNKKLKHKYFKLIIRSYQNTQHKRYNPYIPNDCLI